MFAFGRRRLLVCEWFALTSGLCLICMKCVLNAIISSNVTFFVVFSNNIRALGGEHSIDAVAECKPKTKCRNELKSNLSGMRRKKIIMTSGLTCGFALGV